MPEPLSISERTGLLELAKATALKAYARYSHFRVGAAVLGENRTYVGANVENASIGLTICAERSAMAAAIAAGDKNLRAIAVACIDAPPNGPRGILFPCGACRQWLVELAPLAVVVIAGLEDRDFTVEELLPHAFQLDRR